MYLRRAQISQLYTALLQTTHPLSPPVLILTALTVDSLCATRILTALLRRDYIPHKVQPVAGYNDVQRVGQELVLPLTRQRGGEGGVVVCLGVGGLVDVEEVLGLDDPNAEDGGHVRDHGVEVWLIDARRPWNLQNVFGSGASLDPANEEGAVAAKRGVDAGQLLPTYRPGRGGVIVWDDGDIEAELAVEKEAFMELQKMPEITEDDLMLEERDSQREDQDEPPDSSGSDSRKRKASSQESDDEAEDSDEERPRQRRRSNSSTPIPSSPGGNPFSAQVLRSSTPPTSSQPQSPATMPSSPPKQPSQRQLKRQLLKFRRKHEATLEAYHNLGTSYAEPVSSILYSLASELGREDNDLLWLAIVGISSIDLSPLSQPTSSTRDSKGQRTMDRAEQIREVLRDEVRRLNPIPEIELRRSQSAGENIIPTHARSATDTAIRLSPEPKFLLIRHWSLYDSMLHSPFLSTRLHVWSDAGRKRLNKLLAKMGVSLQEAGKGYVHMDMEIKRSLRQRILKFAEMYNLEGLVPGDDGRSGKEGWGFVRSWGWKATLSAVDVAMTVSAILEVGTGSIGSGWDMKFDSGRGPATYNSRMRALPTPPHSEDGSSQMEGQASGAADAPDWTTFRFFAAYDALSPITTSSTQGLSVLLNYIPTAQNLHRAILRTGSALIAKKQIRHLRAFRMGVVKEGPDVPTFTHPGALTQLAGWVSEAVAVLDAEKGSSRKAAADQALVLGCMDEARGEREEKRKRKQAARAAKQAERARKREERRRIRREIQEANGLIDSDDEDGSDSDSTESASSASSDGSDSESDDELADARKRRGYGANRFGQAFQEVVEETGARVRIDSFEHSVVEVKKEDLAGFLEALSLKSVVG
ncbi:CDC45 family [Neohortaea acidophila]|uniref:CDC45 family n=1 Tax=Neohortaea acidophila TaxID=245834 RepID=A0A6A6PJ29_9PEZI|nr:CDC45 family [Neohortaea acidophila]KAF2480029.1 CDC45 family [Neohortaea acidophila]